MSIYAFLGCSKGYKFGGHVAFTGELCSPQFTGVLEHDPFVCACCIALIFPASAMGLSTSTATASLVSQRTSRYSLAMLPGAATKCRNISLYPFWRGLHYSRSQINASVNALVCDASAFADPVDNRHRTLAGIDVAVKDNICTSDMPTTCSSRMLATFSSPFDATVVKLLRDAGATIIGKANCDEFGMG